MGNLKLVFAALTIYLCFHGSASLAESHPTGNGVSADLPLPSTLPLQDYERVLYPWLMERKYQSLGWRHDKSVRDTGPFINTQYYGTHPAVRIFYSPEVIEWLKAGRAGDLPDGSIIVKEMFHPPAVLYQDMVNNPKYKKPQAYDAFGVLVAPTVLA